MQRCISRLVCLAVLVGILAISTTLSSPIKVNNCCTMSSTEKITAPIIGFRIQTKNLPCIQAVIFETTEGEVCSHWRENWVAQKIRELDQARRARKNSAAKATSSP